MREDKKFNAFTTENTEGIEFLIVKIQSPSMVIFSSLAVKKILYGYLGII